MIGWLWASQAWAMPLWVDTEEEAAEVRAALEVLWPSAELEVVVGAPAGDGLWWHEGTLVWRRGEQHTEGSTERADAAVLLARSWLREPVGDAGWVPSVAEPAPVAPVAGAGDDGWGAPGVVVVGLHDTVTLVGVPDAVRLGGGVSSRWAEAIVLISLSVKSAAPAAAVAVEQLGGNPDEFAFTGNSVGVSGILRALPATPEPRWWTSPVLSLGFEAREVQSRDLRDAEIVPVSDTRLGLGPVPGIGVEVGHGRRFGVQAILADRLDLLGQPVVQDLVAWADLRIRL